jgi:GntR family transcriptional regulator
MLGAGGSLGDDVPAFAQLIGSLEARGRGPLYQKLQQALREAINNRVLAPDEALPPERDLAEEFEVSRITVRKALDGLVAEGLLTRRQGAGTYVASRVEKNFSKLSSFSEDMISRGRTPRSEWLSRVEAAATPEESMVLGLSPGSPVYRFHRIRFADDEPMALEYSTVTGFSLPSAGSVDASLYEALAGAGNRPVRALQRLRAVLFTAEQAALLKVKPGAPGLLIERRGFLKDGRAVEFTQSYYRGDAYDFVAELNTLSA